MRPSPKGDSVFAVFSPVRAAIRAAIDAQRRHATVARGRQLTVDQAVAIAFDE